jgi:hypothetical protein
MALPIIRKTTSDIAFVLLGVNLTVLALGFNPIKIPLVHNLQGYIFSAKHCARNDQLQWVTDLVTKCLGCKFCLISTLSSKQTTKEQCWSKKIQSLELYFFLGIYAAP